MLIGGLQKCTLVDVPGKVAATIFTIGCTFRCFYCHNPELVLPEQYNKPLPCDDVLDFLRSRIGKLEAVCISGGEPTLHNDLIDFIKQVKAMGYFVKLDTSGVLPDKCETIFSTGNVDYIAMDIKAPIDKYERIVRSKNVERSVERSINLIMTSGIDYEFRTTVAKPLLCVNDFHGMGDLIRGAKRHYIQNYVNAGKQVDPTAKLESFTKDELLEAQKIMKQYVDSAHIR